MFKIIAHRGASKVAPENTLSAVKMAVEMGVDGIEVDVHISKDGIPVVIHDSILGRTTRGHELKRVTDLALEEIKTLDAGSWFSPQYEKEKIPTLAEVLSLPRKNCQIMVEIKKGHSQVKSLVEAVVKECLGEDHLLIGSFSKHILEEVRRLYPNGSLIGIVEDFNLLEGIRQMPLKKMAIWYKLLNPTLVKTLHEEGKQVWAFTVDDPKVVSFLSSIGVDGIITNDPEKLNKIRLLA